jgi:hypothetical protein
MKTKLALSFVKYIALLVMLVILNACCLSVYAQNTTFTYQGQLGDGGSPANGNYDLTFTLYASPNIGNPGVAGPVTNSAVAVKNGLFTVQLNFGPGIFTGTNYWLEIAVRPNSTVGFATLSPRQPLTPAPYAIFASSASNLLGSLPSIQLSGALPSAQISGTYAGAVTFNNGANSFIGAFTGNGSGLNSLDASQLVSGTVADARLSPNASLLNNNQTFTGANTFTGVNAFTNFGNSFSGSFFGNGLVGWVPTNGPAVQAVIDTGYVLTSSQLVKVALPATANVGDIVRVSGAGAGGWQIKGAPGQSFLGSFASYSNSYQVSLQSAGNNYDDVAASASGTRVYAVGNGIIGVSVSSDSGRTWNQAAANFSLNCQSVACSANGRIVYAVTTSGDIWKSSNSGATMSDLSVAATTITCTSDGSQYFTGGIACSGNGTYRGKLSGGVITISTNSGSTYNVAVTAPAANLSCLAVSSDCTRLVTGVNGGLLYGSANAGATWTTITTTNQSLSGAWMSGDGSKFATAVSTVGSVNGGIYNYAVSVLPIASTNSITGSQGSAVELQYIGNNQFIPVSSSGTIWAN